jgi:HSP20 family protein
MNNMVKRDSNPMSAMPTARPFGSLVSSLLGQDLSRWLDDDFWGSGNRLAAGTVPVNIRETDKAYEVEVMAPGLKKSDFKVFLDGKQLSVSFEHKEESKQGDEKEGYLRREYRHQSFSRNFTLDDTVDANGISAGYVDGILRLTVPKKPDAQRVTRTVEVK